MENLKISGMVIATITILVIFFVALELNVLHFFGTKRANIQREIFENNKSRVTQSKLPERLCAIWSLPEDY